ncbi:hypothetical protein PUR34_06880 [Streptomyces sp. JV185]|uniref:hypothetical protein n=1 Tax=Streptomyces sp. JV185 TaxID=858638 RepID=UPI002E75C8A2|nr:hypothetical protein [Streptomyces sp. JV185]MEE1767914.1 hypothetical protein [Streptomyces sp. JV185]
MYERHTDKLPPTVPAPAAPTGHSGHSGHSGHEATTVERGSFCTARCPCGWSGPARRSRDRARTDAAEHLAAP